MVLDDVIINFFVIVGYLKPLTSAIAWWRSRFGKPIATCTVPIKSGHSGFF